MGVGLVATLAGGGYQGSTAKGFVDGIGSEAKFDTPLGLAASSLGAIFVADTLNHAIRLISPLGKFSVW